MDRRIWSREEFILVMNWSYTSIGLQFWNNRIPNERKNAGTVYVLR
jgi:hypothetical protein